MVHVSVEGVRRNFGISSVFMYTVTLVDEAGRRMFNFGIERHEAVAILKPGPWPRAPRPWSGGRWRGRARRRRATRRERDPAAQQARPAARGWAPAWR